MRTQGDREASAASGRARPGRLVAGLLGVLWGAAACAGAPRDPAVSGGSGEAGPMDGGGAAELPFDSVYASEQSGIDSPMRTLVRTPGEWASVWASVTGHVSPTPPGPEVDFDRFMLVAVGLGRRPSGGYAARITGIESTPARLTVTVEEVEPGPGCIETMALTAPVIVVRVERVDARVSFREIRRERSCD